MNILLFILISLVAGAIIGGLIAWFLSFKKVMGANEKDDRSMLLMQEQLREIRSTLDTKLSESTKNTSEAIHRQFGESAKIIRDVTERLVKLDETNKQVVNFADQLKNLQDILKNPKQRGVLGEYYLETLLKNVLPPGNYQMQYPFKNGEIVDAVVFVKDKIIPIDSKFSLENYNRLVEARDPLEKERLEKVFMNDLKMRIQETGKYIRPGEGTMEFAFMFIPHEAIYYDLLVNKIGMVTDDTENLIQRAASKYKVIIVSPTSFLAYLQTVLQGLKAMQIEETAKDIIKRVGELGSHLSKYDQYMAKLGNSLSTSVNAYNTASKELKKVDKDILRISGEAVGVENMMLDKPDVEE
ncbi:MAG: DNA recombination protein RmuC [Parcubacteria group bacterium]|nr:DNA recombination protein RmuC [Parcubacteria group bacterium]MCR4342421.1 DNA recombination protein RmuC [Patescibacteria group bacterium]